MIHSYIIVNTQNQSGNWYQLSDIAKIIARGIHIKIQIKNIEPKIHKNSQGCFPITFIHSQIAQKVHFFLHKIEGTDKKTDSLSKSFITSNQSHNQENLLFHHHKVLEIDS